MNVEKLKDGWIAIDFGCGIRSSLSRDDAVNLMKMIADCTHKESDLCAIPEMMPFQIESLKKSRAENARLGIMIDKAREDVKEKEAEIDRLKAGLDNLQEHFASEILENEELRANLKDRNDRIQELSDEIIRLSKVTESKDDEIEKLLEKVDDLKVVSVEVRNTCPGGLVQNNSLSAPFLANRWSWRGDKDGSVIIVGEVWSNPGDQFRPSIAPDRSVEVIKMNRNQIREFMDFLAVSGIVPTSIRKEFNELKDKISERDHEIKVLRKSIHDFQDRLRRMNEEEVTDVGSHDFKIIVANREPDPVDHFDAIKLNLAKLKEKFDFLKDG